MSYILKKAGQLEPARRFVNEGDHVLIESSRRVMIPGKVKHVEGEVVTIQTDDGNLVSVHNSTVYGINKHDNE